MVDTRAKGCERQTPPTSLAAFHSSHENPLTFLLNAFDAAALVVVSCSCAHSQSELAQQGVERNPIMCSIVWCSTASATANGCLFYAVERGRMIPVHAASRGSQFNARGLRWIGTAALPAQQTLRAVEGIARAVSTSPELNMVDSKYMK